MLPPLSESRSSTVQIEAGLPREEYLMLSSGIPLFHGFFLSVYTSFLPGVISAIDIIRSERHTSRCHLGEATKLGMRQIIDVLDSVD